MVVCAINHWAELTQKTQNEKLIPKNVSVATHTSPRYLHVARAAAVEPITVDDGSDCRITNRGTRRRYGRDRTGDGSTGPS